MILQKAFLLQEPDEHEAVEQHTGVPAFVAFVVYALYVLQQGQVLVLVGLEEFFGGFFYVQRRSDAAGGFQHGQTASGVQFGQLDHHGLEFAGEQVNRLAFEVFVAARCQAGLARLGVFVALDPVPLALAGFVLLVGKDEQVLRVAMGDVPPHLHAQGFIRPAPVHHHLDGHHAAQLGHIAVAVGGVSSLVRLPVAACCRPIPAQHIYEEALKVKRLEVFFKGREIELSHVESIVYSATKPREHTTRGSRKAASSSA